MLTTSDPNLACIGVYLLRASGAMALWWLSGHCRPEAIMRLRGRWRTQPSLTCYIHAQIVALTTGSTSSRMRRPVAFHTTLTGVVFPSEAALTNNTRFCRFPEALERPNTPNF